MALDPTVALALGGVVGSALKAFVTNSQETVSRKSLGDILIGGAVGIIYPLYPIVPFPESATVLQQAAIIGLLAYFSSDLIQNVMGRFGGAKGTVAAK